MRPYPPYYRTAFAFSVISYPLFHPPSLRSGYHVRGEHRAYPVVDEEEYVRHGWSLYPGGIHECRRPQSDEAGLPTSHFGYGLSASLAIWHSRGFRMTLHLRSTLPSFPSPSPRRGWQRPEHCPQSFTPQITGQHVWVGTPGHRRARSGSLSPCSILLHEPYEVQRICVRLPPGRSIAKARGFTMVAINGIELNRSLRSGKTPSYHIIPHR
jgi:hypothetical protein